MPWCEECAKYWTPNAVNADGTCPRCGDPMLEPPTSAPGGTAGSTTHARRDAVDEERAPWHFKLLIVATTAYLVWRFIEIFS